MACDTNPWISNSLVLLEGQGRLDDGIFVLSLWHDNPMIQDS